MMAIMLLFEAFAQLADRELPLAEGKILFRFGDKIRSIFLVASGGVRLVRHLPHGPALTLQLAEEGSVLAEASLFADQYHCDAVTVSAARLRVLSRQRAEEAVTRDSGVG